MNNIALAVRLVEHIDQTTLTEVEADVRQASSGREFGGPILASLSAASFLSDTEARVPLKGDFPGGCEWEEKREGGDGGCELHCGDRKIRV